MPICSRLHSYCTVQTVVLLSAVLSCDHQHCCQVFSSTITEWRVLSSRFCEFDIHLWMGSIFWTAWNCSLPLVKSSDVKLFDKSVFDGIFRSHCLLADALLMDYLITMPFSFSQMQSDCIAVLFWFEMEVGSSCVPKLWLMFYVN